MANNNDTARMHLRFGWWMLFVYLTLGIVLEGMHGFKLGWYLDVSNGTRRLMWTLAHAHGTLLALINLVFASTVVALTDWPDAGRRLASRCLRLSALLLPTGFLLAGIKTYGGDPGVGIVLVAVGGLILLLGVLACARATLTARKSS